MMKKTAKSDCSANSNTAHAHDKRYKRFFSNPRIVEELMKYFVDFDFVKELDFSTLELQEKSFISEEHKRSEADMIWKINFNGNDVFIYLLIEFQSTVDKYMALRFGSYIFDFYKWLSKRKDIDDLPAVFPILIYNGDERWTAKDNIKDLIIGSIPPEYIPDFSYFKIIENEIPQEKLLRIHNALSMAFYVENCDIEEVITKLDDIFSVLQEELPELVKEFSSWLTNLFITSGYEMGDLEKKINNLKDTKEVSTMFTASVERYLEKCKREGRLEGKKEGRLEGKLEGRLEGKLEGKLDVVRRMFEKGMTAEEIMDFTGLSHSEVMQVRPN